VIKNIFFVASKYYTLHWTHRCLLLDCCRCRLFSKFFFLFRETFTVTYTSSLDFPLSIWVHISGHRLKKGEEGEEEEEKAVQIVNVS
jgi:hypothetical protein